MITALAAGIVAVGAAGLDTKSANALVDDVWTSYTQPSASLIMPFDATANRATFLLVSNLNGISSGNGAGVTTHWSYWADTCDHLVDVSICLTLNDTIVVDPRDISAVDNNNHPIGPKANLDGRRGFVTVTAYETDTGCHDGISNGLIPVPAAIVGAYTIADTDIGYSFGNDAIGNDLDDSGSYVDLPDFELSPDAATGFLDFLTFNPSNLDASLALAISVQEQKGNGIWGAVELGPLSGVRANVNYYDNQEIATSLPDVTLNCATFATARPGQPNSLVPPTVTIDSSGFFNLVNITYKAVPVVGPDIAVGGDTFVYGVHGQAVGRFGGSHNAKYEVPLLE